MRYVIFKNTALALILGTSLSSYANAAGNPEAGHIKSPSCRFCHGENGIAQRSDYPNLQGQNEQYLINAMNAYRDNLRTGPMAAMMKAQLSSLNEQDIADIAAYYAEMGKGKSGN